MLLLENGCLCCTVRGDLQKALREQLSRRTRGEVPHFRRVVIETSGLADPAPIAYTLLSEAVLRHHFRLSGIVTTVDAVNGAAQIGGFPEAAKQIAMADRLVLTKTDLCDGQLVAALRARLRALNVSADTSLIRMKSAPRLIVCSPTTSTTPKANFARRATGPRRKSARTRTGRTITPRRCNPSWSRSTAPWIGRRSVSGRACCCTVTAPMCCASRVS